ncbi:unannotated protein [freshwater metagenome]|uniref:Unannotated protein n=1 Tax=freshwater metagenome TaxID=449393 RepID=A0A6J7I0V9_9ZZZZ
MSGSDPSLLTAGINDDEPQTLATSSITIATASESAPSPPNSVGTCDAASPARCSALCASSGNLEFSSTSRANGAISFSAKARTLVRRSSYSVGSSNNASIFLYPSFVS